MDDPNQAMLPKYSQASDKAHKLLRNQQNLPWRFSVAYLTFQERRHSTSPLGRASSPPARARGSSM